MKKFLPPNAHSWTESNVSTFGLQERLEREASQHPKIYSETSIYRFHCVWITDFCLGTMNQLICFESKSIEAEFLKFVGKTANDASSGKESYDLLECWWRRDRSDYKSGAASSVIQLLLGVLHHTSCWRYWLVSDRSSKVTDKLVEMQQWVSLSLLVIILINTVLLFVS